MRKKIRKKCANCGYIFDVEEGTKKELKCAKCESNAIDDYEVGLYKPSKPWKPTPNIDPYDPYQPRKPKPDDDWWPTTPWTWIPHYRYWCIVG